MPKHKRKHTGRKKIMQSKTPGTKPPPQQTISFSVNLQELANQNKPENNIEKLKEIQRIKINFFIFDRRGFISFTF